jgi:signal transduction histidine kinase
VTVVAREYPPPALRRWSSAWRYVLAVLVGFFAWGVGLIDSPANGPDAAWERHILDLALGVVALLLLRWRRRAPLPIAVTISLISTLSLASCGAWILAVGSLSTRRRWVDTAIILPLSVATGYANEWLSPTLTPNDWYVSVILGALSTSVIVAVGWYVGARRALLASLQDRAETAEREQSLRVSQARDAERAAIAREMHDVLAHRLSLVAMHASALTFRQDLSPEQMAQAAAVIEDNAHRALDDLRGVLGVLRDKTGDRSGGDPRGVPEPPQPQLSDLPALIDEARGAGAVVRLNGDVTGVGVVPEAVGRHAFRIVQEALTNARKHAPYEAVTVDLRRDEQDRLVVAVSNQLPALGRVSAVPGAGRGLVGLSERAQLAGGELRYGRTADGRFEVRAWLPCGIAEAAPSSARTAAAT